MVSLLCLCLRGRVDLAMLSRCAWQFPTPLNDLQSGNPVRNYIFQRIYVHLKGIESGTTLRGYCRALGMPVIRILPSLWVAQEIVSVLGRGRKYDAADDPKRRRISPDQMVAGEDWLRENHDFQSGRNFRIMDSSWAQGYRDYTKWLAGHPIYRLDYDRYKVSRSAWVKHFIKRVEMAPSSLSHGIAHFANVSEGGVRTKKRAWGDDADEIHLNAHKAKAACQRVAYLRDLQETVASNGRIKIFSGNYDD